MSNSLPIMDGNNGNLHPTCGTTDYLVARLSDPERVLPKMTTRSSSYITALPQKFASIYLNPVTPLHCRMLAAIDVQGAQECQAAEFKIIKDENGVIKLEFVIVHLSQDTWNEIAIILAGLGILMSAAVTEIFKLPLVHMHDNIKAKLVQNVAEMLEDTLQLTYSDLTEGRRSVIFNIVEQVMIEVFRDCWRRIFDKIKFACLMQFESIV